MGRTEGSKNKHVARVSERALRVYTFMRTYLTREGRPPPLTKVAKALGYPMSNVSRIVDSLITKGLSPYVPDYATLTQAELVALFEDSQLGYEDVMQAYQQAQANKRYNKLGLTCEQVEAEWDVHTA